MVHICDLCGEASEEIYEVEFQGEIMYLCKNCKDLGKVIKKVEISKKPKKENITQFKSIKKEKIYDLFDEEGYELVPNYGKLIREKRQKLGLTIEDLAKKLNIQVAYLRRIENEDIEPDEKTIEKLEKFLGCSLREPVKYEIKVSEEDIPNERFSYGFMEIEDKRKYK